MGDTAVKMSNSMYFVKCGSCFVASRPAVNAPPYPIAPTAGSRSLTRRSGRAKAPCLGTLRKDLHISAGKSTKSRRKYTSFTCTTFTISVHRHHRHTLQSNVMESIYQDRDKRCAASFAISPRCGRRQRPAGSGRSMPPTRLGGAGGPCRPSRRPTSGRQAGRLS